jgi:hypothetical protein
VHKSLLISSILLAAAGCAADRGELGAVQNEVVEARANSLIGKVYVSTQTFATTRRVYVEHPDGTSAWTEVPVNVRLKLTFSASTDVSTNDATPLDYEVTIVQMVAETGEVVNPIYPRAARKVEGGYELFGCSSTNVCNDADGYVLMTFHDGVLTVTNHDFFVFSTPIERPPASVDFVVSR